MYRAVTLAAIRAGIRPDDAAGLTALAHRCRLEVTNGEGGLSRIFVDGADVTSQLQGPEVDANVSAVSAVPGVREVLVDAQRRIASQGGIVMAGRDIGTVVLRDADLKVYITASDETRAQRRAAELASQGRAVTYEELLKQIRRRDGKDSTRADSPMKKAEDAVALETDGLTLDEVVDRLEELAVGQARKPLS
jgi:cytidylate kinase